MRKLFLVLSICLFVSANAQTSKDEKTKELLELMGVKNSMKQMIPALIQEMRTKYSDVPQVYWDKFEDKININELVNLLVPIYDKYYTEGDIEQLIEFYKSPIGQKVRKVTPDISMESMNVGRKWGMKIAIEILTDVMNELEADKEKIGREDSDRNIDMHKWN